MRMPGSEEKVLFLSQPENYPVPTTRVEVKETHMSWVFLTDAHAWKLKKPVRTAYLDFSTSQARRKNCEAEISLNQRLARDVYLGIVALTWEGQGKLSLRGKERAIDWLVWMRRLPAERMLDQAIANQTVNEVEVRKVGRLLAEFYQRAAPVTMTAEAYAQQLTREVRANQLALTKPEYGLRITTVHSIAEAQLRFLRDETNILAARVNSEKIIEAHGDLRPEHICLLREPVIIDCLEFNRDFRILDTVSELAFLALECQRLGAPHVGELILQTYAEATGDAPPEKLLRFYQSLHACLRAKIALWHLPDHEIKDRAKWIGKAICYLKLAACLTTRE
jgi:aminoglycoside phosphotransferase family enzyme